ncbi:hypothetical protein DAEQUDRAFT_569261 [Daedalea quercina L-15889]|uniref:Uncharacterized protein n=1 Tax=Daedalea quercina L-15889 TaxID=1314783 RepID=A0A165LW07_9APHY|nr:hypothetical protein DAEQUDRAFT_569261 [Daedalea quercina L-15889]
MLRQRTHRVGDSRSGSVCARLGSLSSPSQSSRARVEPYSIILFYSTHCLCARGLWATAARTGGAGCVRRPNALGNAGPGVGGFSMGWVLSAGRRAPTRRLCVS